MPTTMPGTTLAAAAAVTVAASGLLTVAAPVHAAPLCARYGFAGDVTIKGNGAILELNFTADGTSAHGSATASGDKGGVMTGSIAGGIIEDGPGLHLTFVPDGGGSYVFSGSIRESDLIATGTQTGGTWSTVGPLACLEKRSPLPGEDMFQLSEDTDMYDAPGGVGNKLPGFANGGRDAELVRMLKCQDDNWCQIEVTPGQQVWVWGGAVPEDARF